VVLGQAVVVGGREAPLYVVFALHDADLFQHITKTGLEQVGAFLLHPLRGGLELRLLGTELVVPGAGFTRLQAVFSAAATGQGHDEAVFVLQLVEQCGQLFAQFRRTGGKVGHQQVGQGLLGGLQADVECRIGGQLVDEVDELEQLGLELAVCVTGSKTLDVLEHLFGQLGCGDQVGGNLVVKKVARDHMAQRRICGGQHRLMHDAQLAAQLRHRSGCVDSAQNAFPEAAAHRQQRVVRRHHVFVVGDVLQLGAAQVAGDFAEVGAPDMFYLGLGRGLFGQDDLAGDVLDVPVAQHHLHRKAAHQALEVGHARQRRLAGAHEQQLAVEVLGQGLGDFLHLEGFFRVSADVLLHLVQHYQGQRELAIDGQRGFDGRGHLLTGDVGNLRELFFEQLAGVGLGVRQVRAGFEQRLGEVAGHIHVRQLLRQGATGSVQLCFDRGQDAFALHPQHQLGLVVLLGQSLGLEHDTQKRQAHLVARTRP